MNIRNKKYLKDRCVKVYLGLGGNIGDVRHSFARALSLLDENQNIDIAELSGLYETPPWGDENQDKFLNACVQIETTLSPIELLDFVKKIEAHQKRTKTRKWGPRTIDIDLLIYGDLELKTDRLTIPHPHMKERVFVLLPLRDIAKTLKIEGEATSHWIENQSEDGITKIADGGKWKKKTKTDWFSL